MCVLSLRCACSGCASKACTPQLVCAEHMVHKVGLGCFYAFFSLRCACPACVEPGLHPHSCVRSACGAQHMHKVRGGTLLSLRSACCHGQVQGCRVPATTAARLWRGRPADAADAHATCLQSMNATFPHAANAASPLQDADLIVLEFSANDKKDAPYTDPERRGYEQLVRKLLQLPGRCASAPARAYYAPDAQAHAAAAAAAAAALCGHCSPPTAAPLLSRLHPQASADPAAPLRLVARCGGWRE